MVDYPIDSNVLGVIVGDNTTQRVNNLGDKVFVKLQVGDLNNYSFLEGSPEYNYNTVKIELQKSEWQPLML